MDAVSRYPLQRPALVSKNSEERQKVFDDLGGLKTAMRQQAVIGEGDAQSSEEVERGENHQA